MLFAGNDNIRDTWSPHNAPNMLARAAMVALKYELRRDEDVALALEAVTSAGARACGFADYGIAVGARADLVLLEASCVAEVVVGGLRPLQVISSGVVVGGAATG